MTISDVPPLVTLGSLNGNRLGAEGAKVIAAVLKDSQLSMLGCAAPPQIYTHSAYTLQFPLST